MDDVNIQIKVAALDEFAKLFYQPGPVGLHDLC